VQAPPQLSARFDVAAIAGELQRSAPYQRGHDARTLIKHSDLRLVLIALRAGGRLHQHRTEHRISVQTLSGHVQLGLPDGVVDLPAGQVLVLDRAVPHDLSASEDSVVLLCLSGEPRATPTRSDPFAALRVEHERFSKLIELIELQLDGFARGMDPDYELLQDIFFYLTHYPDRFHHPREDRILARLATRDPACQPLVDELAGHHREIAASGARFLDCLTRALHGTPQSRQAVERPAREYVALYRKHMALEEQQMFPLGRKWLRADDWAELDAELTSGEDPLFGERVADCYQALHCRIASAAQCGCDSR
jgi:hemerythrin-like domain-containing protein/quercetin dioxygenase-like cupin family protein